MNFRRTAASGPRSWLTGALLLAATAGTWAVPPWAPGASVAQAKTACHLLDVGDKVPSGYGAPYDVVSPDDELLVEVVCDGTKATVTAGSGSSDQYVYRYGYQWKNKQWQRVELAGSGLEGGAWYPRQARTTLSRTAAELSDENYVVAHVCTWSGSEWKCGCRDEKCAQPYWQIQGFSHSIESGGSGGESGSGGSAGGSTYYMATSGSDKNDGSISRPWATLNHAMTKLKPGNTLLIRGGTYDPTQVRWTKSGAAGKPITIKAHPGERVIFDYTPGTSQAGIMVGHDQRVSHVVFDGIEFTGKYKRLAMWIWNAENITVRNCYFHDLLVERTGALFIGNGSTPTTRNIIVENNRFENFGKTHYDHALYISGATENVTVRNNYFGGYNAGVPLHNNAQAGRPTSKNTVVYNNVFVLTEGPNRMATYITGNESIAFYNNTFYAAWNSGITYYPNTLIMENKYPVGKTRTKFYNNVVYHIGNTNPDKLISSVDSQNNLFYPRADPNDDKGAVVADPKFVDAQKSNFRLRSGSPAIDAGVAVGQVTRDYDGKSRPRGKGYDIGAFEH